MASIDLNMDDKQLQPRRSRNYSFVQPARQRGLWGQIWMALLQPGQFFRTIPAIDQTRQWLWAALLILALVGLSAVRQASVPAVDPNALLVPADAGFPSPNMFGGGDFGAPPSGIPPGGTGGGTVTNVSSTWTTALLAASSVALGWFIQTVLLCEVSLLRGFSPRPGKNFQIAIWASLPLGLMAALQLLYYAAGGSITSAGISGLIVELPGYTSQSPYVQAIILSFATQLTLFWLWSLALIYVGARRTLQGRWWSSLIVVIAWVVILVTVPVLTGAITAPESGQQGVELESPEVLEGGMDTGVLLLETAEPDQQTSPTEAIIVSPEKGDGTSESD